MKCIIRYATGIYSKLSKLSSDISIFNFGYLSSGHCIYGSKDERIFGYFSKPKRVSELKSVDNTSGVPRGGGLTAPPPKFRSFDKAKPNPQFRAKYIRNNLIRIRGSLICKLSGTPD
jgi:hypothetical protein